MTYYCRQANGVCTSLPECIQLDTCLCTGKKEEVAAMEGVTATLQERGSRYGDFTDNAAYAQQLKRQLQTHPRWALLDATKREALEVIMQKTARILNGDPEYKDNWHDIAGYATLAEERCTTSSEDNKS